MYPVIYGAEETDDWTDPKVWKKANPSLGITVSIDKVQAACDSAKQNPGEENAFRQLRLNQWVKQAVRWMPMDKWDACNFHVNEDDLEGRVCYGGLDLSSTTDITAFVLVFPPMDEDDKFAILPYFWIPEDTLELRVRRDHVPYDIWERQGFLQTTEGNVVHYGYIEKFIEQLGERFNIREIAFDRWGAVQMVQNLEGMLFLHQPTLADYLRNYYDKRNAVAESYAYGTQKAKNTNLKQFAETIRFLEEQDVRTPEQLTEKIQEFDTQLNEVSQRLKKQLAALQRVNVNLYAMKEYFETRPVIMLRRDRAKVEKITGLNCAIFLDRTTFYIKEKLLEEGIPFVPKGKQVYLPFIGYLLSNANERELTPVYLISFLTQKMLLVAIYERWNEVKVSEAAERLSVSRKSASRCFDELEYLNIDVLGMKGKSRVINVPDDRKEFWKENIGILRNPVIRKFVLREDIKLEKKAGISALCEYSLLSDNAYPTYAVTKKKLKASGVKMEKQASVSEDIGCVVLELGYFIDFFGKGLQDPLSVALSLTREEQEERVKISVNEMLEEYVWSKD